MQKAVFQPVICHHMFWMVDLIVLANILDDDYVRNYNNVGELSSETDRDSQSIFDWYLDTRDDISDSMGLEQEQCTMLSV